MKNTIFNIISAAMTALILIGCKPTETNYQAAYDAALQKREQRAKEEMRPATGLLSDDGPQMRVYDGDTIYVIQERLRELDGSRMPGHWAVGVGMFKMDTNAKATVSDLKQKGFADARVAKMTGGRFYAVSDTATNLESVIVKAKIFKSAFPGYPYVGLPDSPVLINY